jgi:hypothetical protein
MLIRRSGFTFLLVMLAVRVADAATIDITTPVAPPRWALMERHLFDLMHEAAVDFVKRYTRDDGTLVWRDAWPGMDGSDDGYESFFNFALFYILGGDEEIHRIARKEWDAVTRQFTRYGQVHKEFDAYYDWMHHGESYIYIYYLGLADHTVAKDRARALRFAGLYMNEDPEALNYDFEHKRIRSPINGSRGPRFINSAEDWSTHREVLSHYPLPFDDIPGVTDSKAWVDDKLFPNILEAMNRRMMQSDVPQNLACTSLMLNALMYTGDEKYRTWILDYTDAWRQRIRDNNGIMPDNVGPSGKIGEHMDGNWWGGYYGWKWPHGFFTIIEPTTIAAENAYLLTGDASYLSMPRSQLDLVTGMEQVKDGKRLVPTKHDQRGWYAYQPLRPTYHVHLWNVSQSKEDWRRLESVRGDDDWLTVGDFRTKGDYGHEAPWVRFVTGHHPDYPEKILAVTYSQVRQRMQRIAADHTDPKTWDVHHWQELNPVVLEGLVQLTLGGPQPLYHGGVLHCRVRYFDPQRRRPGLPPDVAVLVTRIEPERTTLQLVNTSPSHAREMIIQAGAFGEHSFSSVKTVDGKTETIGGRHLRVRLAPGAGGRLVLGMKRYVNPPAYGFPW